MKLVTGNFTGYRLTGNHLTTLLTFTIYMVNPGYSKSLKGESMWNAAEDFHVTQPILVRQGTYLNILLNLQYGS